MTYAHLTRLFLVFATAMQLSACALMGPPTGIVRINDTKTFGTYRWSDGSRYEGGFKDKQFDGPGTIYYRMRGERVYEYDQSRDPDQFDDASLATQFANGRRLIGHAILTVPPFNNKNGFTFEGRMESGTRGEGRVNFHDGRVYVGHFDYTPAQYYWHDREAREKWGSSAMLGSKITGAGTWTWPDGSVFTGVTYDYYLFDRNAGGTDENYCHQSQFIGQGTLKVPGQPDYVGLVGEDYGHANPSPIGKEDFDEMVGEIASCPGKVAAERQRGQYLQAQYDASMAQARADAHNMLMRDLASISAQNANTLAEMSAASRGTTVQAEQAKAERDAQFYSDIAKEQEDPNSQYNQDKRAEENRRREEECLNKERQAASEAARKKRNESTASAAEEERTASERQQADDKKKKEDADLKAQQERDKQRLAAQEQAAETLKRAQKKRAEEEEAYQVKVAQEKQARDEAFAKQKYLDTMTSSIKLAARHCPDGKGLHYVVGLRPTVKPVPVSCIDVHYTASCPGNAAASPGVISSFVGAGTDCFFGDAGTINPTPSCEPKDVRVQVTKVVACNE